MRVDCRAADDGGDSRSRVRVNPYAIGVNDRGARTKQPVTNHEAIKVARNLIASGANIDLGLGQINSKNLEWLNLSVEDAFDPCSNLAAAGRVLETGFRASQAKGNDGQNALQMAFSAYNTGNYERGFANGYVGKVLEASARLVPAIEHSELLAPEPKGSTKSVERKAQLSAEREPLALNVFQSEHAKRVNLFD